MAFWDNLKWDFGGAGDKDNFWGKLWDQDRMDDSWRGFFKEGGWKDWKSYVNPGGIVANPAGQIADPGNFFTAQEHENWLNGTGPSDRTKMSALVAGAVYGGGSLLNGAGSGVGGEANSASLFDFGGKGSTGSSGGGFLDYAKMGLNAASKSGKTTEKQDPDQFDPYIPKRRQQASLPPAKQYTLGTEQPAQRLKDIKTEDLELSKTFNNDKRPAREKLYAMLGNYNGKY